jgi:hypothetical protein
MTHVYSLWLINPFTMRTVKGKVGKLGIIALFSVSNKIL